MTTTSIPVLAARPQDLSGLTPLQREGIIPVGIWDIEGECSNCARKIWLTPKAVALLAQMSMVIRCIHCVPLDRLGEDYYNLNQDRLVPVPGSPFAQPQRER